MSLEDLAQKNMETRFVDNPCRGIVLGLCHENGKQMQIYWIMGRSENSQNRIFVGENGILRTEAADPSKVKDPSLIIYNAMRFNGYNGAHVVSNGDQTDTLYDGFKHRCKPGRFRKALAKRYCEPDAPVFTPRISGYQHPASANMVFLSILKADQAAKEAWLEKGKESGYNPNEFPTARYFFESPVSRGFGYCLTTYKEGTSKTLDSFEGEPFIVPLKGSLEEAMGSFWNRLEQQWRVSLGGVEFSGNPSRRINQPYTLHETRYAKPINRFEAVR